MYVLLFAATAVFADGDLCGGVTGIMSAISSGLPAILYWRNCRSSGQIYLQNCLSRQRRVIVKAEHLVKGDNTRFIVTNLKGEPKELYDELSCQRGDAENRIKEQQLGLFADRTSCHDFVANQFRVALWAAAYILMDTLRRQGLADTELANAQVGTIRNKLLKIGARVICSVRRIVFHLASGYPFRNIFIRVLARLSKLSTPSISSG